MNVSEIKVKLFQQIDSLDNNKIEELYGIVENFMNGQVDMEEWDKLTFAQKQGIENGISELDADKGVPHNIVMDELRKKYGNS